MPLTVEPLPDWARGTRQAFDEFANWRRRRLHQAWSLTRQVPKFLLLLLVYAPRGGARLVMLGWRFLWDQDTAHMRHALATAMDSTEYDRASKRRRENLRSRWLVATTGALVVSVLPLAYLAPHVLGGIVGLGVVAITVYLIPGKSVTEYVVALAPGGLAYWGVPKLLAYLPPVPTGWVVTLGVLAVLALGWVGRPEDRGLVQAATPVASERLRITAPYAIDALLTLGISGLDDKHRDDIRLLSDVARVGDNGVQVDLELPAGVPAGAVMERRERLAAALRRELGCVWPFVGERHPGHLVLFISDVPMARARQEPWPLAKTGRVDIFDPFPAFTDRRGEWVNLTIAYSSMVIGAVPRVGKTYVLREMLLVAGLDPRTKVYAFDGKGTGDLAACAQFAHCYVRGARADQPERIEKVREAVRGLCAEIGRRADILDGLPRDQAPDSKITSELVDSRPDLDLGPIVVGVDETQSYFSFGYSSNKEHRAIRAELKDGMTEIAKLGPAVGIWLILASQQVKESTIPTDIAQNAVIRFCLKIEGHEPNDRVLGTGAYKRGVDAQMFDFEDKGIGYLKADGSVPKIVRSVHGLDGVAAEEVAARARKLRVAAGRLSGDAAGEGWESEREQVELIEDVRSVLDAAGVDQVHLSDLRARLELFRSETYKHLTVDALGAQLRAAGVAPRTVWSSTSKSGGKGVKREWLDGEASDA